MGKQLGAAARADCGNFIMIREIHIKPVLNGFVVLVGCQTVVIDSVAKLAAEIGSYYTNPQAVEEKYKLSAINNTLQEVPAPMAAEQPPQCGIYTEPVGMIANQRR